nr:PREDICTED: uncharacterized protein LOC105673729 [Linepithema humile]
MKSINFINSPLLPIIFAQSEYLPHGQCKEDVLRFLNELQRGTLWAAQMYDASSKYPSGILYGHTRHLGNFDECYNLQVDRKRKDTLAGKITGKYCLVDLLYEKKHTLMNSKKSVMFDFDPNESVWEAIKEKGNFLRIRRYHLQLALCVPSSCKAKDVEMALKTSQQINTYNYIKIHIAVQSRFCQTIEEGPRFTAAAKIYCTILLGWLSFIIGSTWYDVKVINEKEHISTFQNVILHFSVRRNLKSIFQIDNSHPELKSLYIVRFASSILTPLYAIILFFFVWIFPLLDSGPFWKREVEEEAAKCAANWWANLLYIHNYVKPLELCMYHTWHLSVDFQLFILSHFVIYMFWRMPRKIGYLFLGTLTIVGSIIPFIATYLYNVSPIFRVTPVIHNVQEVSYFKTYYIKTHFRFSAYLIGIITGAILYDHKQIKWQVPKGWEIVPDAIYAFAISLVLTVCVEEPFRKLAKQIFPN